MQTEYPLVPVRMRGCTGAQRNPPCTLHEKRPARIALPAVVPLPHYCGVGSPCGAPDAASFSNALADKRTRPFSSVWMTLTFTCWPSFR